MALMEFEKVESYERPLSKKKRTRITSSLRQGRKIVQK